MLSANREGYLPLIIVVHYKTVCNNYILSINYLFKLLNGCHLIGTIKPSLHLLLTLLINSLLINTCEALNLQFSNISFIFIKKKNTFPIWYVMGKGRRMSSAKGGFKLVYHRAPHILCHCFYSILCVFCNFVYSNQILVGVDLHLV